MIGVVNKSNPGPMQRPGQRNGSSLRRVTFSAEPQTKGGTRSRPLPSSPRSPRLPLSSSSSPRSGDVALSQHLTVISYGLGPTRGSGVSGGNLRGKQNTARTLSAERHNPSARRRTQSAGLSSSLAKSSSYQGLRKSSDTQTPSALHHHAKTPPPPPPSPPPQPLPGADMYISSLNAIRQQQQQQQNITKAEASRPHSSASVTLRKSTAMCASRPDPAPQQRLRIPRPQTTASSQLKSRSSRRLGADMYPRYQRGDLERERAWFRSEVCLIGDILQAASRPQSMKWRAAGVPRQQQAVSFDNNEADWFCRASVAEPFMNNAGKAKVFHVVPQRVVSARGGASIPGASVALQRLNQSTCQRHALLHRAVASNNKQQYRHQPGSAKSSKNDTAIAAFDYNDNGDDKARSSSDEADNDDRHSSDVSENAQIVATRSGDGINNDDEDNFDNESARKNHDVYENDAPANTAAANGTNIENVATQPTHNRSSSSSRSSQKAVCDDRSQAAARSQQSGRSVSSSRGATTPALDFPRDFLLSGLKGVDVLNDHSSIWLEETRLKNQESVAILSEQLMSMIPTPEDREEKGAKFSQSESSAFVPYQHQEEDTRLDPAADQQLATSPPSLSLELRSPREEVDNSKSVMVTEHVTPRTPQVPKAWEDRRQDGDEEGGERCSGRKGLCMKTMQCEVLGPYSCSDCTKIRFHERHSQEQTSLYPGITADPRTLVAPDRIRKLTASLPPALVSQRHALDCGCSIQMHPDFLFPVIVTDNDVHSRLRNLKSTQSKTERADGSIMEVGSDATLAKRRRSRSMTDKATNGPKEKEAGGGKVMGDESGDRGDRFGDVLMQSPVDMKVTVRYNTPSPDHKGVFLTNGL